MRVGGAGPTDRADADYIVRGVPLDATGSFRRGYGRAPTRIRELSRAVESYDPDAGVDLADVAVHDAGDLDVWPDVADVLSFTEGLVADDVDASATPVLLGGEHTVSIAGLRGTDADVYVALDAHLDLRTEHQGERLHHACVSSRALDAGASLVVAGARSGSAAEHERLEMADATAVGTDAFGPDAVREAVPTDADVYLSVDLDVVDPGAAPGVGTPEPFGVAPAAVRDVVRSLAPRAVGFDVVECVPAYDDGEATAALAAGLFRTFVAHASRSP